MQRIIGAGRMSGTLKPQDDAPSTAIRLADSQHVVGLSWLKALLFSVR
jgi:hypothetical protein